MIKEELGSSIIQSKYLLLTSTNLNHKQTSHRIQLNENFLGNEMDPNLDREQDRDSINSLGLST